MRNFMTYEVICEFMYMKNIMKTYLKSWVSRFQMTAVQDLHPRSHHRDKGAIRMQLGQEIPYS